MFKKLFDELLAATTPEEINDILYRFPDGVDVAYQNEKLGWKDHERLFQLAGRLDQLMTKEG